MLWYSRSYTAARQLASGTASSRTTRTATAPGCTPRQGACVAILSTRVQRRRHRPGRNGSPLAAPASTCVRSAAIPSSRCHKSCWSGGRRAISSPSPVPQEYLDAMLSSPPRPPPGYNLQPWRFIVVRERRIRKGCKRRGWPAEDRGKAGGSYRHWHERRKWKKRADDSFYRRPKRGFGKPENTQKYMEGRGLGLSLHAADERVGQPPHDDRLHHAHARRRSLRLLTPPRWKALSRRGEEGIRHSRRSRSRGPARHRPGQTAGQTLRRTVRAGRIVYAEKYGEAEKVSPRKTRGLDVASPRGRGG